MADFSFENWASDSGLSEATVGTLEKEEANSLDSLLALNKEHMQLLNLPVGQLALLMKAVEALQKPKMETEPTLETEPISTKTLAANKELNELLGQLKDTHLSDILHQHQSPDYVDPALMTAHSGEHHMHSIKPLLIPDFVIDIKKGLYEEDEEDWLTTKSGAKLSLKLSKKKKPHPEEVTVPQWIGANARIVLKKLTSQSITMAEIKDYLLYTAKIGDLLQQYTPESVMVMDDVHRRKQAMEHTRFADIELHTQLVHLEKKNPISSLKSNQKPNKQARRDQRKRDNTGKEICISYNQQSGCHFANCKYSHVCMVQGCQGDHPQFKHDAMPPRFRHPTSSD